MIEPGHRGVLFDPRHGGLQHEVLGPGYHRVGVWGRIDDFDVTFSTRKEDLHTISSEGLGMEVKVSIIFRPVVSELYEIVGQVAAEGVSILIVEQFARTVLAIAHAAAIMLHGQVVRVGSPAELEEELSAAYLGA